MVFNETLSLIFHGNEQILSACGNTISSLLFIHFCYIWFVTSFALALPIMLIVAMSVPLLTWFERSQKRLEDCSMFERDYSRTVAIRQSILHEIRLMIIYVFFAAIFTSFTNHGSIHLIRIVYWLIEACSVPLTSIAILDVYCNYTDEYGIYFSCPLTRLWLDMLEGTLFLWMRYTERYPSSILNDSTILIGILSRWSVNNHSSLIHPYRCIR